jgi:hypothetical protein
MVSRHLMGRRCWKQDAPADVLVVGLTFYILMMSVSQKGV